MFDQKILCLGNNSEDTDSRTSLLAVENNTENYGLISSADFVPVEVGYYHTTILDIPFGGIIELAQQFDCVVMHDQPVEEWSHWKPLLSTYKLMLELDKSGYGTVYKDNNNIKKYSTFEKFLKENKSFCIYPWINFVEEGGRLTTCARSSITVTTREKLIDWKTNADYQKIRGAMLRGERLPEHCKRCYQYEDYGIESYRTFETKEWISKLDINSIEDLDKIEHPYYYEVRLSNKCNLMCRSCNPAHSHLIDQEFKKHNIIYSAPLRFEYSSLDVIDISTLGPKTRVYLTGGEPTIMTEVLEFMRNCIRAGKTDFDFTLGTNAQKISPAFLALTDHFTNMNFSISLDGYGKVNDYWRHGSDWDTVISNTKLLESRGHNISINTVPGIYNVTNLHLLFEFLDQEFPHTAVYLQINRFGPQSAYNHPNPELVIASLDRCRKTKMYHSDGKSNKTCIDSLYNHYSQNPVCDLKLLKEFFDYNNRLDQVRGVMLKDFIPELESAQSLVQCG